MRQRIVEETEDLGSEPALEAGYSAHVVDFS